MTLRLAGLLLLGLGTLLATDAETLEWSSNGVSVKEEILIDESKNLEVFRVKTSNPDNYLEAVIDFKTDTIGVFMKNEKYCHLIKGISKVIERPKALKAALKLDDDERNSFTKLTYNQRKNGQVKNRNRLPSSLQQACKGREIYWMDNVSTQQSSIFVSWQPVKTDNKLDCIKCFGTKNWVIKINFANVNVINHFNHGFDLFNMG